MQTGLLVALGCSMQVELSFQRSLKIDRVNA